MKALLDLIELLRIQASHSPCSADVDLMLRAAKAIEELLRERRERDE